MTLLLLVAPGCAGGERDAQVQGALEASPERCTLETALEPGIPGSPGHLIPSDRNPNGLSELAGLMRAMTDDVLAARDAIARGEAPAPLGEHHYQMRCAWPTDAKARNPVYDGLSVHYLGRLEELNAAGPAEHRARYDALVDACVTCHQARCPGPLAAIEELRFAPR